MRAIITGGSGLIGQALALNLVKNNYEVIILSRSPQQTHQLGDGIQIKGWDAKSAAGWGHLADGATAIINLAGANVAGEGFFPARWTATRKQIIRQSRLNASKAVIEAVKQAKQKPNVIIQSSAIGYYGSTTSDKIITETNQGGNDFLADVCIEWEKSIEPVKKEGVRVATVRTGVVLSTNGGALTRLLLPFKFFAGGPMGSGKHWFSWIHITDEIEAIRFLIENKQAEGAFNLTAPNPLTNAQFSKVLGQVINRPSFMPTPAFIMRLAFGEVATIVVDGQRVLPERLQEIGFQFQYPEAKKALEDLLK